MPSLRAILITLTSLSLLLYYFYTFSLGPGPVDRKIRLGQSSFTTHGFNFHFNPSFYHRPTTLSEIASIVKRANENKQNIRVIGGGHSWTPMINSSHHLISLDEYDGIISVDVEKLQATFEAGIRIGTLARQLEQHGLGLQNMGTTDKQSFAGAFLTGTHGTGSRFGILASTIISLQIVDGMGNVHNVSAEENPELFFASRVSLGALGIVTQVTVQCVKFYHLHRKFTPATLDDALARAKELDSANRNFKFWWIPRTPFVRLIQWKHVEPTHLSSETLHAFTLQLDALKTGLLVAISKSLAPYAEIVYPRLMHIVGTLFNTEESLTGPYYDLLPSPAPYTHQESEWFVPADKAVEAMQEYRKMLDTNNCWTNMVSELRFIAEDESWLSPAYKRPSATINMLLVGNDAEFERCAPLMEQLLGPQSRFQGRPHWAKIHSLTPSEIRRLYPKWEAFLAMKASMDPNGVFENEYLRKLFA